MVTNTTFYNVTTEHSARLREIAEQLGYVSDWGRSKGEGSASMLVRAIAEGDVGLMPFVDSQGRQWHILERDDGSISIYYVREGVSGCYVVYDSLDDEGEVNE